MAAAASGEEMVTLISSDKEAFCVKRSAAEMSLTVKSVLEDTDGGPVPLPNVASGTLRNVIEFFDHNTPDYDHAWSNGYLHRFVCDHQRDEFSIHRLMALLEAANYLNATPLLNAVNSTLASVIQHRDPRSIRKVFGIDREFTDAEIADAKAAQPWAFD